MDSLDFLDAPKGAETAAAPEQPAQAPAPAEATPAPTEGQPRGPDGKFAPKAQADAPAPAEAQPQAPAPSPEAAQPDPAKPPEGFVPVSALQAEREKRQQLERQYQQQPQQPAPDVYDDPEAFQQWQQGQLLAERTKWSFDVAVLRHGEDQANEVKAWAAERFANDPIFAQRALASRDPYGVAFDEYQQQQALSLLADPANRQKFMAFLSGQAPAQQAAPPVVVAPPSPPSTPPASMAADPNAGGAKPGAVPTDPGAVFDAVFRK